MAANRKHRGRQRGPQPHAEGQHGKRTHDAFIEGRKSPEPRDEVVKGTGRLASHFEREGVSLDAARSNGPRRPGRS